MDNLPLLGSPVNFFNLNFYLDTMIILIPGQCHSFWDKHCFGKFYNNQSVFWPNKHSCSIETTRQQSFTLHLTIFLKDIIISIEKRCGLHMQKLYQIKQYIFYWRVIAIGFCIHGYVLSNSPTKNVKHMLKIQLSLIMNRLLFIILLKLFGYWSDTRVA